MAGAVLAATAARATHLLAASLLPAPGDVVARPSLYSPTPPVIPRRLQPHTAAEPVNPRTPLRAGFQCRVFPGSASSTTLVLSARRGQHGQGMTSIGRVLYMERLTARSIVAARKCLLISRK